jgi:hypothetical protein
MEHIFEESNIISDLSKIIRKYLTNNQNNLLNKKYEKIKIGEIIKYDPKLMIIIEEIIDKTKIFEICAKYGKLENMKWSPSRLRRFASRNIAAQCICFAN